MHGTSFQGVTATGHKELGYQVLASPCRWHAHKYMISLRVRASHSTSHTHVVVGDVF